MKLGPLVEILENPEIIKTGVAVKDDLQNLNKIEELKPKPDSRTWLNWPNLSKSSKQGLLT